MFRLKKRTLTVVVTIAIVAVAGTYFGATYLFPPVCPSRATLRPFAIVANVTSGYNGSRYQPFSMDVQKGDCVSITFINNDQQVHGLFIATYVNGIVVQGGQSETVKFQATKTGQFQIGEQLLSTINSFTDKAGTLNVA